MEVFRLQPRCFHHPPLAQKLMRSNLRRPTILAAILWIATTVGWTSPLKAQDPSSILSVLGKFVSGFTGGAAYLAPVGAIRGHELKSSGLQEVGLYFRNPSLDLLVGFDLLTGVKAKEESLEIRGSIMALPSLTVAGSVPFVRVPGGVTTSAGVTLGLSHLHDMRTIIPQSSAPSRAIQVNGDGFHGGVNFSLAKEIGPSMGIFVTDAVRYTRLPSLDWKEGANSIVPPARWPGTLQFWTNTIRIGVGIARAQKKDADDPKKNTGT